ncbi:MAG: IS200/IS605 family transposase [Patescibacteria group bacterium]
MVNIEKDIWHWYHNVSECHYHIQLTIKYRKSLFIEKTENIIMETMKGYKERYAIEINHVGFDKNHVHLLLRFLPKFSGGQVIRLIKSISSKVIFREFPKIKEELWGGEFWTDGYYIATVSGRGSKKVIENYIKSQGREQDIKQLRLFEL